MTLRLRANLLLAMVALVWGSTFVLVKNALGDVSPTLFNFMRMALACSALAVVYRPRAKTISSRQWIGGALTGACLAGGYQFQTIGLRYTTASKSAFITGSVVVIVPLYTAAWWLARRRSHGKAGQRPDARAMLGAVIAFAGLALLTLPPGASGGEMLRAVNPGDWLTLACAFVFGFHLLSMERSARFTPHGTLALLQTGFAAIFLAASMPFLEKPHLHWTPRLYIALVVTSLFATAMAFAIQSWAQTILSVTNIALLFTLEPVFAWITSVLVLQERLTVRGWAGALLVLGGILFTELRLKPEVSPAGAS
jgi:drug/metabolite transporter (DMT)-like permease